MLVEVKLFAIAKQFVGADLIHLELSEPATIEQLRGVLLQQVPKLQPMSNSLRFAVNSDYASDEFVLSDQDDIACIPPVSGG